MGSEEEGKEKYRGALLYKYFSWVGGGTVYFCCLQTWVQAFRVGRQLYDNTNNGIEAQNKMFKYSFLNCCQNMSMSRLIYLLIHVFVPTQMVK